MASITSAFSRSAWRLISAIRSSRSFFQLLQSLDLSFR